MTEISGKSLHEIYKEDARKYKESIEKDLKAKKRNATDKLSVEKIQEIRVEELKDFNLKILQAELKNQKLQKEIDAAKKYIEESYKADKEDNKLLDLIIEAVAKLKSDNKTLKKALTNIKWRTERDELETYYVERNHDIRKDAIDALAAIGGDDE